MEAKMEAKLNSKQNRNENHDDFYVHGKDVPKSYNPPIPSRHAPSLTMQNFNAYSHILNKFQD